MKNIIKTTLISLITLTVLSLEARATCSEDVDMGNHKIINVSDPISAHDLATKNYVDMAISEMNDEIPTRQFSRDDDKEIVTDSQTGLMWQDNVYPVQKPWLTEDDFNVCKADTSDDICKNNPPKEGTAQRYCFDLNLGGYSDWQLPTKGELDGIIKINIGLPTIDAVFQNTYPSYYWSSTSNLNNNKNAWYLSFYHGLQSNTDKNNDFYVRCVRSE